MTEISEAALDEKIVGAKKKHKAGTNIRDDRRSAYWVTEKAYRDLKHIGVDLGISLTVLVSNILEGLTSLSNEDRVDLGEKLYKAGTEQRRRRQMKDENN